MLKVTLFGHSTGRGEGGRGGGSGEWEECGKDRKGGRGERKWGMVNGERWKGGERKEAAYAFR